MSDSASAGLQRSEACGMPPAEFMALKALQDQRVRLTFRDGQSLIGWLEG